MGCSLLKLPQAYWKKLAQGSAVLSRNEESRPRSGCSSALIGFCPLIGRESATHTNDAKQRFIFFMNRLRIKQSAVQATFGMHTMLAHLLPVSVIRVTTSCDTRN